MMEEMCEEVDRPSLAEAKENAERYGRAAGFDRSSDEIYVRSRYTAEPRKQASFAEDIVYWQRRVPTPFNVQFMQSRFNVQMCAWNRATTQCESQRL